MPQNTDDTGIVTILLILIGAFVIIPMFVMGVGMMGAGPMMGGMWGGGMWGDGTAGWMFLVGVVLQLLFLAAIIGGSYLIYRAIAGSESEGENNSDQALEALRLAYARGELTDDEYEQRRAALERDTE